MEQNPYLTPSANLYGASTGGGDNVSPSTVAQLAGTKPWVRFMSVLMWIGAAFCLFGAVIVFLASSQGAMGLPKGNNTAYNLGFAVGMAAYYGVAAFMMLYPAIKLWKYANAIGRLVAAPTLAELDSALTEQRRYWKFTGILVLVSFSLVVLGIVAVAAFGLFASGQLK